METTVKEESFGTVKIHEFESFGTVNVFEVIVQPLTVQKHVLIKLWNTPKCAAKKVVLHVHHGSYPLFAVTNKTLPPTESGHYLYRTHQERFVLSSNSTHSIVLPTPLPGSWFVSIYASSSSPQSRHQTSENKECLCFLQLSTKSVIMTSVTELSSVNPVKVMLQKGAAFQVFRFWIDGNTWSYHIKLVECVNGKDSCPMEMFVRGGSISLNESQSSYVNCSKTNLQCEVKVLSPRIEMWQYIVVKKKVDMEILLHLNISVQKTCNNKNILDPRKESQDTTLVKEPYPGSIIPLHKSIFTADNSDLLPMMFDGNSIQNNSIILNSEHTSDVKIQILDRVEDIYNPLNTSFYPSYGGLLKASVDVVNVYRYDLSSRDTGGLLVISLNFVDTGKQNFMDVIILVCIQRSRIPINDNQLYCLDAPNIYSFSKNSKMNLTLDLTYPYPEPGPWFLGMQATCVIPHNLKHSPCANKTFELQHKIRITACPECENGGICTETIKAHRRLAYCFCKAGYQGFRCEDESHAASPGTQKMYTYFLTLSNLFFIPAICVAIFRRYYVEALVYFTNMFFSSFYHACDVGNWSKYYYCLLPYNVLKFTDFMLSLSSFWMTSLALAQLPHKLSNVLQVAGIMGIAIDVAVNATGIVYDAVPISLGGAIVLLSWLIRCAKYRTFYPKKWRWCTLIPGILIAGTGIIIFTVVETYDNYPYTHSVWHICMSTSILFLLPGGKQKCDCTDIVSEFDINDRYAELENVVDQEEQQQNSPVVLNSSILDNNG